MVDYCENTKTCRHKILCKYFGDKVDDVENMKDGKNTFCDFACDVWYFLAQKVLIKVVILREHNIKR
jgi:hypothetical protein